MLLQKYKETVRLVKELLNLRGLLVVASLVLVVCGTVGGAVLQWPPIVKSQAISWDIEAVYEVTNISSATPGSGTTSNNYRDKVSTREGNYLTTSITNADGGWDGQVYRFKVNNPDGGYGRITVRWEGYGESADGYPVTVELYNRRSNPARWELANHGQTNEIGENIVITVDLVDNFSSYVDDEGVLWVRVRAQNLELVAPSKILATAVASNEVRLSWNDNASDETGYRVERQLVPAAGNATVAPVVIATLPANSKVYTDYDASRTGLLAGREYKYVVRALAGSSQSGSAKSGRIGLPSVGKRQSPTISVPRDATSIQEALNLSQPRDTVFVASGVYHEALVIRTHSVTLAGAGVDSTTIEVPDTCINEYCAGVSVITNNDSAVNVRDLAINNGGGVLRDNKRYGGGVYVEGSAADLSRLLLLRSALLGNESQGGSIALRNPKVVTVDNVAAMFNVSSGATIYISNADSGVVFNHVTIAGNGSQGMSPAAGIWVEKSLGAVDVVNSILWGNSNRNREAASDEQSKALRVARTFIGPVISGEEKVTDPELIDIENRDPKLVSYDDPHLRPESPAINFADSGSGTEYDYENMPRPQGGGYDAGASEYAASKKAVVPKKSRPLARPVIVPQLHASLNTDFIELDIEPVSAPAAPSNLEAIEATEDRISIRFLDNATNEDGFIVYRALGEDGPDQALVPIAARSGTGDVIFPDYGADLPSGRLAPGTTYCYKVAAYVGSATAISPRICEDTIGVEGNPPAAPTNVQAVGISAGQIRLTWDDNSNDEDGFVLYRKRQSEGVDFSIVSPPAVANAESYIDSGGDTPEGILESGATYCYLVAAYNVHGLSAAVPSSPACVATPLETWVEVLQGSGGSGDAPSLSNLGTHTDTQFQDENDSIVLETDLADLSDPQNAYNWQVFAVHLDTPPAGLTSLTLRWRGHGEDQPSYPVRFSLFNFDANSWDHRPMFGEEVEGDVRPVGGSPYSLFTFTFTSAQLSSLYSGTAAGYPNTVLLWVRAKAYVPPPAPPTSLTVVTPNPTTVSLAWVDASNDETGFEVQYRAVSDTEWATLIITEAGVTSHSYTVPVASSYVYRVRAVRGVAGSDFTSEVTAHTPLHPPHGVYVVAQSSDAIQVNWQLNSSNPIRFPRGAYATIVYRAPGTNPLPSDWALVKTVTGGVITYTSGGLEPHTTYSYKLRFVVRDGGVTRYSTYSESVFTITAPLGAPAVPEDLVAIPAPAPASQINLSWNDVVGELGYALDRQDKLTGTWHTVDANIPANQTDFGDVSLVPGQLYSYRLRAWNDAGYSIYSNIARATTPYTSIERWELWSSLPLRNGIVQGATVLASHNGYLYAASNDADNADGKGTPGWSHLNIWRYTNGAVWTWVGETAANIDGNVPVAMVSYGDRLHLLTGSRLWVSNLDGSSWSRVFNQGVGDSASNGYFSHLTVFNGKLYTLLSDGSVFYNDGKVWHELKDAPNGVRVLAQYNNTLLAAVQTPARPPTAPNLALYQSPDGTNWTLLGTVPGEDDSGQCAAFKSLFGLGSRIYSGATNFSFDYCLRVSGDNGSSWARTTNLDIWSVLPGASAYVVTTAPYAEFHDPMAAKINSSTGIIEILPVYNLTTGYRLWSVARHGSENYAAAFNPVSASPSLPPKILHIVDK